MHICNSFFEALEALQAMGDVSDNDIIAVAIEHMRAMPYYAKLFEQFSFAGEWTDKIKDAGDRYQAALKVFNDISEAKEMAEKAKDTEEIAITVIKTFTGLRIQGLERLSKELAGLVGALAKQVSSADKLAGLLNKAEEKKYILVDENRIKEMESAEYKEITKKLTENNYKICTELPDGVDLVNVIRLIDPGDLEKMPRQTGMFYLPMLYTRSALYMSALVLQAGGDLDKVPLVKGLIKELYTELDEDELKLLITQPWQILPKIQGVIRNLDDLRKAVILIEKAA